MVRRQIKSRAGLEASAQAGQQVPGHIALAVPDLLRAGPVDINREHRLIERLLDAQVGGAGDSAYLLHQLFGEGTVLVYLQARHLQVDLCGQAEVQNLAHHVGGQVVELGTGEIPVQFVAQARACTRTWADASRPATPGCRRRRCPRGPSSSRKDSGPSRAPRCCR